MFDNLMALLIVAISVYLLITAIKLMIKAIRPSKRLSADETEEKPIDWEHQYSKAIVNTVCDQLNDEGILGFDKSISEYSNHLDLYWNNGIMHTKDGKTVSFIVGQPDTIYIDEVPYKIPSRINVHGDPDNKELFKQIYG